MSKPTDESYRLWLDTEYSKGLTGGEALRSAYDSGAKWQRERNSTEDRIKHSLDQQEGKVDSEAEPDYSKVCDVEYGDWVLIIWQGEELDGIVDEGYVLGWPSHQDRDANMAGIVHIPHPQNPGGKDDPPMEWVTLQDLRTNPMVRQVRRKA